MYFRKNPFGGEYTVFAGLEECIRFIANFKLTEDEISFIRESLPPSCEVNHFFFFLNRRDNIPNIVHAGRCKFRFITTEGALVDLVLCSFL